MRYTIPNTLYAIEPTHNGFEIQKQRTRTVHGRLCRDCRRVRRNPFSPTPKCYL